MMRRGCFPEIEMQHARIVCTGVPPQLPSPPFSSVPSPCLMSPIPPMPCYHACIQSHAHTNSPYEPISR
ncbi:hypothetical protein CGRA01v4_05454 [Colletotrichum graminicola]|nr:hypothetical protein CGRA01v4_05454 [Colletotrichum graminicola]